MDNSEQPAFPPSKNNLGLSVSMKDLTKREYFAGLAMQGLISSYKSGLPNANDLVENSILYADELLKQLEQK